MSSYYATTRERPVKTRRCKPKQQRQLKVREGLHPYQLNQQANQRVPIGEILLKGKWLVEAGFSIHAHVTIHIEHGKLVLTAE